MPSLNHFLRVHFFAWHTTVVLDTTSFPPNTVPPQMFPLPTFPHCDISSIATFQNIVFLPLLDDFFATVGNITNAVNKAGKLG